MTKSHRLVKKGKIGRPSKAVPKRMNYASRLGGIPMYYEEGKIIYKSNFPHWYNIKSSEEIQREDAILEQGDGDFVRRHIYEFRFGIKDESDKERRKREYKEWIEKYI